MTISEFIYTVLLKPRLLKNSANWIIRRFVPSRVTVEGAIIYLNANDPVISGALSLRLYERDEIKFFKKYFSPHMTFIDIGANVGLYTGLALSTEGFSGTIVCMEPHDESRYFLLKTIRANNKTSSGYKLLVSDMAASDKEGVATLYKNSQNKGDNRLYPDYLLDESEEIKMTTLDNICLRNNISNIDFLKVDVQGGEDKVMAGASNIIEKSENCIILSEFWPYGLSKFGSDADDYLARLESLGFSLFNLGKGSSIAPLNLREIVGSTKGRSYKNIVGFKGRYLELINS